ncbi:hypothetical protein IX307_002443 [Bacteroides pyogenes]|uniref:hypothetical protein n=1 Tax=Bacteroides pyogenes TaxID=310300 RepID=UPI001BA738AB|nr:hypothetical protein [Bacteroides pyogenes]MBR8721199.1 hypothetical protein [Bacteroides pyogenes]MBR8723881.1 hypothetical protein [Bacteroides pyogenes]MBR8737100.1 hypothetical protein [Bacteroides pyogenes]MBR8753005.1 hypothetical protein [Bacteroides pyogenes]MBR8788105.1 hypothetical protein [Bacteroides pyogenes]
MKHYFIATCIVLLAMSCSDDSNKEPLPAPPVETTLTLTIPGFRSASETTRAGVHEEQIDEIDVLLFRRVSGTERVAAMLQIPAASLHSTDIPGEAKLTTNIPAGEYSRLALVVNAHKELTASGITATSPGSPYADLRNVQTTGRYGNLGFGPDKSIPMYGEYHPAGGIKIEADMPKVFPGTVGLIRSMARVDFVNQEASPDFEPKAVFFNNAAENGAVYVEPTAYGVDLDEGNSGNAYLSPTLPASGLTPAPGSDGSNGLFFEWDFSNRTYYLYEQPASGPSALSTLGITRPRMVLKAAYKGQETWYPVDFTWDGVKGGGTAPYAKGTPMPVLRNHRYVFTIKEVKGPGHPTWKEAFTAPQILPGQGSPLTIDTHVIDESYADVMYDNQGFLAVSRTSMTLKGACTTASTNNKVEVLTNVTGGFKVASFNDNGTEVPAGGWLRPSTTGGAANTTTTVQAITDGKDFKNGYLEVRAGRLYAKVNVKQINKLPLDYVAEYNLAGGFQYGSSFSSSDPAYPSPTAAQTDMQLRWATNHNNDQSGYYNWYVLKGVAEDTYNPAGKNLFDDAFFTTGEGKGYHLPSRQELTGVFSYNKQVQYDTSIDQSVNEACEYGGIKKTFAADYYSTGNGVCYALRFKQATGDPNDDSPLSEFPKAADNSMCCAYRYTRIGSFAGNNNLDSHLKVECVYLGEAGASTAIGTISNDAWWNTHSAEIVTRIFPAAGWISRAPVSGSGLLLYSRGYDGCCWGPGYNSSDAWGAYFNSRYAHLNSYHNKFNGVSVRLFASE